MKVLCVIDSLGSGGAQRQLIELAKGFKEEGHNVSFLTYHDINFFKPELDNRSIKVTTILESNYLKRTLKVRSFIRKTKPDSVISFLQGASFMTTLAGIPAKKWTLIVGERSANPNVLTSMKLRFYRWFHIFADYVVANSNANLSLIRKINPFLKESKLKVIYNMVNIPEKLAKIDYTSKKIIKIVIAASYRPVKNLDGLIEAVQKLPVDYLKRVEINWFGNIEDAEYAAKMKDEIERSDLSKVIIINRANENVFEKYIEADYVGLFSHYEGFPNTICEAMAARMPVIVTKVSDIPLFIKDDYNGFTCDSKNTDSIKEALMRAIDCTEEDRAKMGKRNKNIATECFGKKMILSSYLSLMQHGK